MSHFYLVMCGRRDMKTGVIIALVVVIGVIALALGATIGYSISSGRTSTITLTGKTLTTSQTQTVTYYGTPQGLVTATELIMMVQGGEFGWVVCGTSTFPGGVAIVFNTTTTEYIFPQITNDTSQGRFLNVTITTTTTSVTSNINVTTVTVTYGLVSHNSTTMTVCPIFG